jgi:3-hydroxymyristoyl/3-hydroxydecanoyl-(acyl carrier protein) dehydratase
MRFLFVSQIDQIDGQKIHGKVEFSDKEPWRHTNAKGDACINNSVVSEAVGQLVSWMALRDNDFTGRPVFLFLDRINFQGSVPAPGVVDLEAWISNRDEDSFIFSGTAKVNGQTILEITDSGGYFMPLAELEDPAVTRQRFEALTSGGIGANPSGPQFDTTKLVDEIKDVTPGQSVSAIKVMRPDEPFYADHFPRFPVTPIVVINEMIMEATRRMMTEIGAGSGGTPRGIEPVAVQDLKIKSFIRPGDTAITNVKVVERFGDEFETISEILINQKRILRGRYRYRYI